MSWRARSVSDWSDAPAAPILYNHFVESIPYLLRLSSVLTEGLERLPADHRQAAHRLPRAASAMTVASPAGRGSPTCTTPASACAAWPCSTASRPRSPRASAQFLLREPDRPGRRRRFLLAPVLLCPRRAGRRAEDPRRGPGRLARTRHRALRVVPRPDGGYAKTPADTRAAPITPSWSRSATSCWTGPCPDPRSCCTFSPADDATTAASSRSRR